MHTQSDLKLMYNSKLSVIATNRSEKPAKGQIICQRTDYLSFYRFTDLLNNRLKLSELNVCQKNFTNCDFRIQMQC